MSCGSMLRCKASALLHQALRIHLDALEPLHAAGHVLVAEQIQGRVEQHRAVAGRKDEAVAIRPVAVRGIEFHHLGEEHGGDIGAAHGQAGVTGIGFFDRVHGKGPDRIGQFVLLGCVRHRSRPLVDAEKGRNIKGREAARPPPKGGLRHNRFGPAVNVAKGVPRPVYRAI